MNFYASSSYVKKIGYLVYTRPDGFLLCINIKNNVTLSCFINLYLVVICHICDYIIPLELVQKMHEFKY